MEIFFKQRWTWKIGENGRNRLKVLNTLGDSFIAKNTLPSYTRVLQTNPRQESLSLLDGLLHFCHILDGLSLLPLQLE